MWNVVPQSKLDQYDALFLLVCKDKDCIPDELEIIARILWHAGFGREQDGGRMKVALKDIRIYAKFAKSKPSEEKYKACLAYYLENDKQDRKIVVNEHGFLVDGYVMYLVLINTGAKFADIEQLGGECNIEKTNYYWNKPTTYIYGIHRFPKVGKEHKEYVWRVPTCKRELIYGNILPGDVVLCNTKHGNAPVVVSRIEEHDTCPVNRRVKKFICKLESVENKVVAS